MRHRRRHAHAPPLRRRAVRLTAQQQIDARRAPTPTAFCMRPATATLGIRVTASVTLRELYGAHGAGIRGFDDLGSQHQGMEQLVRWGSIIPESAVADARGRMPAQEIYTLMTTLSKV